MRKFGFIISLYKTNELLAQNTLNIKWKGDDAEQLVKDELTRTLEKEMVEDKKGKE